MQKQFTVNREHKDKLFRFLFKEKKELLSLYNAVGDRPERQTLKLSQAFEASGAKPCLEFECTVLNVNYGKNKELLGKCQTLMGYAKLIDKIRHYESYGRPLADAIDQAIGECIKENILSGFLKPYRSEVTNMILEEYDEQKHIENEKRWSFEDGQELINRLHAQLIEDNRIEDLKLSCVNPKVQQRLLLEYGLSV